MAKKKKQQTITRKEVVRMASINSPRLPQTVNDGGERKQWVGIGWVTEGPADGTEEAIIVDQEKAHATTSS
jgi:hypothetical protein